MSKRTIQIDSSIHHKVRLLSAQKDIRIGDMAGKLVLLGLSAYEKRSENSLDLPGSPPHNVGHSEEIA